MTATVLQERASDATGGGANISIAFLSNNTVGSAIHAISTWGDTVITLSSITDTNNSYGAVLNAIQTGAPTSQSQAHCIAVNIAAGANTVQANFSSSVAFRGIWAREIGSVTTAPTDGTNAQAQNAPGTGTDAVSSLTATNTIQPVLMSAVTLDAGFVTPPAIGTGFTLGSNTNWTFGGGNGATSEHARFTNTNAKAATFTAQNAASATLTSMAMFDEAVAGVTNNLAWIKG